VVIDPATEFGKRVLKRLDREWIIWLVTVRADGTPQPSPVWFIWEQQSFLVYSQPDTPKLRNIERNPKVALHFDGDGRGGDIVTFSGEAEVAPDAPPADQVPAYVAKYDEAIKRIGMNPEYFAKGYSVAIRIRPTLLRGH
jgi:PPOX class probable F420-dependent enzyme